MEVGRETAMRRGVIAIAVVSVAVGCSGSDATSGDTASEWRTRAIKEAEAHMAARPGAPFTGVCLGEGTGRDGSDWSLTGDKWSPREERCPSGTEYLEMVDGRVSR